MYTIVDIDTGEDITKQSNSLILKTIEYVKEQRKFNKPDGTKGSYWNTIRICKVFGKQNELRFD